MPKIVIVGGGFAGCAAAAAAAKVGARVVLIERMEVLGGLGLLAGQSNHRQFPSKEELRLMDAYDMFQVIDNCTLHENVKMPWPFGSHIYHDIFFHFQYSMTTYTIFLFPQNEQSTSLLPLENRREYPSCKHSQAYFELLAANF